MEQTMTIFIITVLVLACWQSISKFSLLPWYWSILLIGGISAMPFISASGAAASSMNGLTAFFADPAVLDNWCALIVIQELFTLVTGFSLLNDRAQKELVNTGCKKRFPVLKAAKYLIFCPSVLLPGGIFYLQMFLFNYVTRLSFSTLSWLLAAGAGLTALLIISGMKLLQRDFSGRVLTVLHGEIFLLFSAIFLPAASRARLVSGGASANAADALLLLAGFAGSVLFFAVIMYLYKNKKLKGKKCLQ